MIFDNTYMESKKDDFDLLERRKPINGAQVQDWLLHDTDESQLTERDRLIMILTAIVYEVEHDMLTDELSDELYFYYQDLQAGKLDGILGEDEETEIKADIKKYYTVVFNP